MHNNVFTFPVAVQSSSVSDIMIRSNDCERQVCIRVKKHRSQLTTTGFKVEEININVPWGRIAGKWWGPKSVRPILCIHGWQDNCGTFDPLIIQLPDHVSYLAIDLPGHGRSSRIPNGMVYSTEIYFSTLMLICDHFHWDKISLMAHSLGSVISFLFASAYPDKCDMVIGFDTLKPYSNIFKLIHRHFSNGLRKSIEADVRNLHQQEPPSYTYQDLLTKVKSGIFIQITDEAAPYLLQRSVLPSTSAPCKYYFARDSRLKASPIPMMDHDLLRMFARNITSPYCFLKSTVKHNVENQAHYDEIVRIMNENPKFEYHLIEGDHHVHLNEPSKVSGIIATFIDKYRPRQMPSKL